MTLPSADLPALPTSTMSVSQAFSPLSMAPLSIEELEYLLALPRDGRRVRVVSMRCQACGAFCSLERMVVTADSGALREIAKLPHSEECAGQVQFELEATAIEVQS